jgi:large subunit ribosomal protein L23
MTSISGATFRQYDIIRYPLMTEKSNMILEKTGAYVFVVSKDATKPEIKEAIQKIFNVDVVSVNTILSKGKKKVFRGHVGRRSDFKKAIIRIKEGQRIELGTGV